MKSAITNIGRAFIANNTTGGVWFSITHFGLAWVNDTERANNPAEATASKLVLDAGNGDYIYNIWQTPFKYDGTGRKYGVGDSLPTGFGGYYKYEYDECTNRNSLTCYSSDVSSLTYGFKDNGVTLYGATSSITGSLTLDNIPAPLYYNTTTASTYGTKTCSKFFPIKAFTTVETTDDSIDSKVTLMNYQLELPAVTVNSANSTYVLENAIGNFKFNRIGLYVTLSTYPDDIPGLVTSLEPVADTEPVLFAIIDLTNDEVCSSNILDILKTRDDTGLASFSYDAQLSLTSVNEYPCFASAANMYIDAVRDDATNWYLNQLENNANTSEAIMQLQLQLSQITKALAKMTGTDLSVNVRSGFNSISFLETNSETYIGNTSNKIYYFKGDLFRSYDDTSINTYNAIINIYDTNNANVSIQDGEQLQIIIDNLDGRYFTDATNGAYWQGKIYINNYNSTLKEKLAIIDSTVIKSKTSAKVTIDLEYCLENTTWIVSNITAFDENNILS